MASPLVVVQLVVAEVAAVLGSRELLLLLHDQSSGGRAGQAEQRLT